MTTADLLQAKREEILRIAERHGARNVRVFGSVARGEATEESDIDLVVSTTEHTSPWFHGGPDDRPSGPPGSQGHAPCDTGGGL